MTLPLVLCGYLLACVIVFAALGLLLEGTKREAEDALRRRVEGCRVKRLDEDAAVEEAIRVMREAS